MSRDVCPLFHALSCACVLVKHDVSNLWKIRRCWMSSNAELHSQVIEVAEKPHYSMGTVGAANSAEEAGQDCIMGWW